MKALQRYSWWLLDRLPWFGGLWDLIDSRGIVVFVGPNGSGKSLAMVRSAEATLQGVRWECFDVDHQHLRPYADHAAGCGICTAGRKWRDAPRCADGDRLVEAGSSGQRLIYSTVTLLGDDGDPHPLFVPLEDYRQLPGIEHADVFFDEVAGVSDSSDSASMPVQVTNWLHQLRKRDVRLRVTTPAYSRCSKPIRQACQLVVDSRAFFVDTSTSGRLWRPRRAMMYFAYDAFTFDDFNAHRSETAKPMARGLVWRPGSVTERRYDTLGQVLALGHVSDSGMCMVCGGARSRPKCSCSPDTDMIPVEDLVVVEKVSASGTRVRAAKLRSAAVVSETA